MANYQRVSPRNRAKLNPILKWMGKSNHPFTKCYRANVKRFGPDRAKRICAVNKDLLMGTTKWRKGGRRKRR
jgi:hypothetical protein